ncbi:AraC family transcriptional regulator [Streptomyces griseoaurantiacus]|uniref:AraC family transcriptional regulator n=1 Tax=Streptomyces griseoaurantiacus TaxID=68213 RepID=UPI0034614375
MENGHLAVRRLRYLPAVGSPYGVEVLDFAALRAMDPQRRRTLPQRPDFHVLALVGSGTGGHEADFRAHGLREGSVVWIRPGTVHRWSDVETVDGPLVLFRPAFLPGFTAAEAAAPVCWELDAPRLDLALLAAGHLGREHRAVAVTPARASGELLSHLLAALLLRVLPAGTGAGPGEADGDGRGAGGTAPSGGRHAEVFRAYRTAVEEHFADWHHVTDYARALGHDVRTLTRATRAVTGEGAKAFLDQRVLLEAKRILAHTDVPVAGCARRLGFADAGNFTTFFRRQTGIPPGAWRESAEAGREGARAGREGAGAGREGARAGALPGGPR